MKNKIKSKIEKFYKRNYKTLMVIPIILMIFSFVMIYNTIQNEGTPIYRDISLKGGLSTNIYVDTKVTTTELENYLNNKYPDKEFSISELNENGKKVGFIIDTNLEEEILKKELEKYFNVTFDSQNYSSNFISPSLSNSFFIQAVWILIISFLLMSAVIFLYFREFVPAFAIILSAFFDILVTIGILNSFKYKISISGIGTLLMLIGYSIDTDILLTNRLLKEPGKNYIEKIFDAFKTGITMSITTLLAGLVAFLFTNSKIIKEIALIILVGLTVDVISTWLQNSGILLWWLNKKSK